MSGPAGELDPAGEPEQEWPEVGRPECPTMSNSAEKPSKRRARKHLLDLVPGKSLVTLARAVTRSQWLSTWGNLYPPPPFWSSWKCLDGFFFCHHNLRWRYATGI